MGNVFSSCRRHRIGSQKEITLLMIGLDNAGKTCTANHLLGVSVEDSVPTVGFTSIQIRHGRFSVCIFDVGGGPKIRGIWNNYYALIHGLIFVVDASDNQRFEECKQEIHNVLQDHRIAGKPMLLLFNKHDMDDAVNETELVTHLDLEALVNEQQCPTRVEASCAILDSGKTRDAGIQEGFNWLIGHIEKEFPLLNVRVENEKAEQTKREQEERKLRMERVQKLREEREHAAKKLESHCEDQNDDDDVIEGNPFKPMNAIREELKSREHKKLSQILPDIKVIQVSPTNSSAGGDEVPLQSKLLEGTSASQFKSPSHAVNASSLTTQSFLTSVLANENEKKTSKKPKKRFKNKIAPQDSEGASLSHLSPTSTLPPLRPIGESFINGDLPTYDSPKRHYSSLNGKTKLDVNKEVMCGNDSFNISEAN